MTPGCHLNHQPKGPLPRRQNLVWVHHRQLRWSQISYRLETDLRCRQLWKTLEEFTQYQNYLPYLFALDGTVLGSAPNFEFLIVIHVQTKEIINTSNWQETKIVCPWNWRARPVAIQKAFSACCAQTRPQTGEVASRDWWIDELWWSSRTRIGFGLNRGAIIFVGMEKNFFLYPFSFLPSLHSLEWPEPGLWLMVIHKDQAIVIGSNLDGSLFSFMQYGTKKMISFIILFLHQSINLKGKY